LNSLREVQDVDEAIAYDGRLENLLARIRPNIIVKGQEFKSEFNEEELYLKAYECELIFSPGIPKRSRESIESRNRKDRVSFFDFSTGFCNRHGVDKERIINLIGQFSKLKVLVIGDIIIDEYVDCFPIGMSQEDPTIVVSPHVTNTFIGGAGIVAAHGVSLGADVSLYSKIGNDDAGSFARESLLEYGISDLVSAEKLRRTVVKRRYRSRGKTLLRVNSMNHAGSEKKLSDRVLRCCEEAHYDTLVFADFNYGSLPDELIPDCINIARKKNATIVADCQASSQFGDITKFKGVDLITPTEHEARLSLKNYRDGLTVLSDKLLETTKCNYVFLKLGVDGFLVDCRPGLLQPNDIRTDQLHALNRSPVDVAGAGDSMLMVSALTLAAGGTIWEAAILASTLAAIQVSRVGNVPISLEDLTTNISDAF